MTVWIATLVAGLALLVWGADRFVLGSVGLARALGVSPILIGVTVVGFGTSAPELLVSATAAWEGSPGIAVGNAIGSNIANVGLVLGATALVAPIAVESQTLRREFPLMLGVLVLAWALLRDGHLGRTDGMILIAAGVVLMGLIVRIAGAERSVDPLAAGGAPRGGLGVGRAALWIAVGLVALLAGSRAMVWAAAAIAGFLGVSDLVIGLSVVAVGTSLPELAASVTSMLKGERDLAMGNVLGSNMFNLLPVLALPGIIAPGPVDPGAMQRDFPIMAALSVVLFLLALGPRGAGRVTRLEGGVLLGAFVCYQALLFATGV